MLKELQQYGVNGLADPTPMGIGRDKNYVKFAQIESGEWQEYFDTFAATAIVEGDM